MMVVQQGSLFDEKLDNEADQRVVGLNESVRYQQLYDIMEEKCAESMESVLVYTGVYSKPASVQSLEKSSEANILVDHGHRDFSFDSELLTPSMEAHNILDAIHQIFEIEGFK